VIVDAVLEQTDEMLYDFLMDFARDNKLQTERTSDYSTDDD
jgi:hypothetical protein